MDTIELETGETYTVESYGSTGVSISPMNGAFVHVPVFVSERDGQVLIGEHFRVTSDAPAEQITAIDIEHDKKG